MLSYLWSRKIVFPIVSKESDLFSESCIAKGDFFRIRILFNTYGLSFTAGTLRNLYTFMSSVTLSVNVTEDIFIHRQFFIIILMKESTFDFIQIYDFDH